MTVVVVELLLLSSDEEEEEEDALMIDGRTAAMVAPAAAFLGLPLRFMGRRLHR